MSNPRIDSRARRLAVLILLGGPTIALWDKPDDLARFTALALVVAVIVLIPTPQ